MTWEGITLLSLAAFLQPFLTFISFGFKLSFAPLFVHLNVLKINLRSTCIVMSYFTALGSTVTSLRSNLALIDAVRATLYIVTY